jgi:hypothetical protein
MPPRRRADYRMVKSTVSVYSTLSGRQEPLLQIDSATTSVGRGFLPLSLPLPRRMPLNAMVNEAFIWSRYEDVLDELEPIGL